MPIGDYLVNVMLLHARQRYRRETAACGYDHKLAGLLLHK